MRKVRLQSLDTETEEFRMNTEWGIFYNRDTARVDKMVEWLFENTSHRFVLLGTDTVYFESDEDALHFMMVWN